VRLEVSINKVPNTFEWEKKNVMTQEKIDAYENWLVEHGVVKPHQLSVSQVQWGVGVKCNVTSTGEQG
jgi:hypothetical protein